MLSGLLAAGKVEEAQNYLKGVETEMDTLPRLYCVNPYINAVLVRYDQIFREMGAECSMEIQVGEEALPYMEL